MKNLDPVAAVDFDFDYDHFEPRWNKNVAAKNWEKENSASGSLNKSSSIKKLWHAQKERRVKFTKQNQTAGSKSKKKQTADGFLLELRMALEHQDPIP